MFGGGSIVRTCSVCFFPQPFPFHLICPSCGSRSPESTTTTFRDFRPYRPEPITTTFFDDDEPLPSNTPPTHQPASRATAATIKTFPEFPAVAASDSPSDFAVLIKARAPAPPPGITHRAPIDLVAVLDVSGSMRGQKLALVKRAVRFIINTLGPSDRLSVVSFSDDAYRVLNLRCMSDSGRVHASVAVDTLTVLFGTNIKAGLKTGVHVLNERRHRNPVAGVILLSDGQDTYGGGWFGGPQRTEYRDALPGYNVPIHTFGFGSDHDPMALHTISDASGGTFSFIEREESIQDAFAMCIGGLLSVVAQQVSIMVSPASPGIRIASVASGSYRSGVINHGLAATIEIGDLYADEEKDFLVSISIPAEGVQLAMPLLAVKCSYKEPLTKEIIHVDGETAVIRRPGSLSPEDQVVSVMVDGQRNRILVAESMREAQGWAEKGDLEGAKAVLERRRTVLLASAAAQAGDELSGWLDAELQEIQKRMANELVYAQSGRAYGLSGMSSHLQQRAAAGAIASGVSAYSASASSGPQASSSGGGAAHELFFGGEAEPTPFGQMQGSFSGGRGPQFGAGPPPFGRASASGVVGYQTPAMRGMVERSQQEARGQIVQKQNIAED